MPHDAGDVLRTGALAPLLGAALDDARQGDALADVQRADALGAVELVAGQGEHIDVLLLDVDVQMADGLHGVGVEQDALLPCRPRRSPRWAGWSRSRCWRTWW